MTGPGIYSAIPEDDHVKITEPGIYPDLPSDVYHAQHDWLSWSMMKRLIPPSTPAHFKAALSAGEEHRRAFDLGKAVHTLVLGDGDEYQIVMRDDVPAVDFRSKAAQEHRDAIYEAGKVPLLATELGQAQAMADAIKAHPAASHLISDGAPEVSLFWVDEETGVKCRARLDWLPNTSPLIVTDVKTTDIAAGASPVEFARQSAKLGYYGQARHYLDGVIALGIDPDPRWAFVTVETADPFLVSVGRFDDPDDQRLARAVVDHCRRLYADCLAADNWPGYGDGINTLRLPMWLHYLMEDAEIVSAGVELKL